MELKAGFVCDRGLNPRRPVNQDRFLAIPERGLFAVFDGVGGQKAGEVASQTAADTVEEALTHIKADSSPELIRRAIQFANRDIFEMSESDPAYKTMATTVALLHVDGNLATIAHVGDSRVYRLEEGRFYRETVDHTDYNDELRAGVASKDRLGDRAQNVINRALGVEADVEVEVKSVRVRDGVRFLLCSDGIYRHLSDEEIARVLAQVKDPQRAADELKRIVHERGADDNLTAVIVQVGRARQSAVLAIEDGMSSYRGGQKTGARAAGVTESAPRAPRDGRIRVDFGRDRQPREQRFPEARPLERQSAQSGATAERSYAGPSASRRLVWAVVVIVLMGAAFYAGLRASDWSKAGTSKPSAPELNDPLKAGRSAFEGGNYQAAASQFTAMTERDPQNAEAHYWLGRAQVELGEYAKAILNLDHAVTLRPTLYDAYPYLAAAYEAVGDRAKAAQTLSRYAEERRRQPAPRLDNSNSSLR
ncbi:MAG TPA: protein phosphatase 2C domain-containing protein [Blastocatellia bacterium]|nr:protein phosphatase 2C domain-containing protein [Blastocatellia bacterium]